jgi:cysteine desulfurase family protein
MIYLDNSATTMLKPVGVAEAVANAINESGSYARGAYTSAIWAGRTLHEARKEIAKLFNLGDNQTVAFCANATTALNTAILGAIEPGSHVITSVLEHNAVLRPLYRMQQTAGISIDFLPADDIGNIHVEDAKRLLRRDTKALILTHASNVTGNSVDIAAFGKFARENELLFIVDAAQSAGSIPIDFDSMNADILCFTGHKYLMGPQGTGGLCMKKSTRIDPLIYGGTGVDSFNHDQPINYPDRLEAGTQNIHSIAGLLFALKFINETGLENIIARKMALFTQLYMGLQTIDNITIYGDIYQKERTSTLSINIGDMDSAMVSDILSTEYDICTRSGAHCAPKMHEALGTERQGAVRLSISYFNTERNIEETINALSAIAF